MPNKALDFDGASGLVTVSDATAIQNIFDSGGAIEFWLNADSDGEGNAGKIVTKGWYILTYSDDASTVRIIFSLPFSGDDIDWRLAQGQLSLNTWTHFVITYNSSSTGNTPILYLNGSAVSGANWAQAGAPTGTRDTDAGTNLIIGNVAGDSETFDGTIDEVRLYTRILGSTEVTANYNGGAGRYWPSNMNNLVAWWHMDEGAGSSIYDQTNRGNTGTITSASWVNGFDFLIQKDVPRR